MRVSTVELADPLEVRPKGKTRKAISQVCHMADKMLKKT
jgi:hypothetical protein